MGISCRRRAGVSKSRAASAIVLGILLGISGALASPPAAATADSASDIPGVPLTPGVVVGPLGGSIYDAVYSLDVAPGTVILASLSGSAGTDFDLYLFDDSATTVVTNQGVVARSTGPTSTEAISYAAPVGGRFYIDLNSATAALGTYTLAVQVIPDRPPVAKVVLDGGIGSTNTAAVSVTLTGSGSLSGPAEMAFSNDATTWGPWSPYQAVTTWVFAGGDGTKTLWAKIRNSAGIASAATSSTIVLDTQPPAVALVDPAITDELVGPRPTITVTFSEPIAPASWTQLGLVVQTQDGALVPGTFTITAPDAGSYRPSVDLVRGEAYVLTVGPVTDVAGNLAVSSGSWVAIDRPAPELTLQAVPAMVDRGGTALLSGRLTAPMGVASLSLEARPAGALQLVPLGAVSIRPDGSFSTRVTPSSTTEYRLGVAAAGGFGAGTARAVVSVRRTVRVNWSTSATHAGRVGARVSIVATAGPADGGLPVAFRLERWSPVSRAWRLVGTLNRRTDASGRASVSWTPSGTGLYRWRATAGWAPDYSTGSSAWVRWSIVR